MRDPIPADRNRFVRRGGPVIVGLLVLALGAQAATGGSHVVRRGETLSGIAADHGVSVRDLAAANGIGDPHRVLAGATLTIPEANGGGTAIAGTHTVRPGDTLSAVARRYGVTQAALVDANGLASRHRIRAGQKLRIPAGGGGDATASGGADRSLPARLQASPERLALVARFEHWSATYGVPADLLMAMTWNESGWQNHVVSSTGARGIGQLMPDTVAFVGPVLLGARLDPGDPDANIRMSARFLRYLLDQNAGDVRRSLASYYQGLRAVRERGIYPQTTAYVDTVLALRPRF